jgi:hypothetical protein
MGLHPRTLSGDGRELALAPTNWGDGKRMFERQPANASALQSASFDGDIVVGSVGEWSPTDGRRAADDLVAA